MANFIGTPGNDTYPGTTDGDTIDGLAGNDTLRGDAGNDRIDGNAGNDSLFGDAGDDIINGGTGDDIIQGGLGRDTLDGGNGVDRVDYTTFNGDGVYDLVTGTANLGVFTEQMLNFESIIAGNGNDIITLPFFAGGVFKPVLIDTFAGGGNDLVNGGAGQDYIFGGAGNDTIKGNAGDDIIQGGLGQDTLDGGAGNDTVDYTTFNGNGIYNLVAGTANLGVFTEQMLNFENITTGGGSDTIYGSAANNFINGGAGNDYIQGGLGQDTLNGGDGDDTVDYTTFNGGGTYNLTAGTAILPGAFTETMANFENIYTGAGNDTIVGTSDRNTIYGGAGDDRIEGGDGDDYIQGGLGRDTLFGGDGIDYVDYTTFSGNGTYDLVTEVAYLGVFEEVMVGFEGIVAGAGNDTIRGSTVANYLEGGSGDDTIYGNAGDDIILGNEGNDSIYGQVGDDYIQGDAGDDNIYGQVGNDTLFGDAGNDKFYFGSAALSGANTVANSIGRDSIYDFTQGQDSIVLSKTAFLNITTSISILGVPIEFLNFGVATTDAAAATSGAAIVYSRASGNLFYNPNGTAAGFTTAGGPNGGNFAYVSGLPAGVDLAYSDFVLIA